MGRDFIAYLQSLGKGWFALLTGGIVSFSIGWWEHYKQASISHGVYGIILGICLFVASFVAWRSEHKQRIAAEHPIEPEDSLRRRTTALADEVELFVRERFRLYRAIVGTDENPFEPQKRQHEQQTIDMFRVKFSQRLKGLSQELEAIGVNTEIYPGSGMSFGDADAHQNFGFDVKNTALLRHLAYRIDHNDKPVRF